MQLLSLGFAGCFIISAYLLVNHRRRPRSALPLPPRPAQVFPIGNLRNFPKGGDEWVKYHQLAKDLDSDVVYLEVFGRSVLVLDSLQAAHDLLDKKGAIYSDRPKLPFLKDLAGWNWNLVIMDYGRSFIVHRRLVQQQFQANVVSRSYHSIIEGAVKSLLTRLDKTPERFTHHLKMYINTGRLAGSITLMVTYGHNIETGEDPYVKLQEQTRDASLKPPGSLLLHLMPSLKYLPQWFPFTTFHRSARVCRDLHTRMRREPFLEVKHQLENGTALPSMTASLLESEFSTDGLDREEVIMNCSGVIYSAGTETTLASLTTFFLVMVQNPEIMKKGQAELDKVVGLDRLPSFADRPNLPYINAIVKEILRWHPVSCLGVPHCSTEDDEYRGWFIPKGTIVIPNIWAILRDPKIYDLPDTFMPERYIPQHPGGPVAPDPSCAVFGFGRRICPGQYLADASLWLTIASVLCLFNIIRPKDEYDDQAMTFVSGLVNPPTSLKCIIEPRHQRSERLLKSLYIDQ